MISVAFTSIKIDHMSWSVERIEKELLLSNVSVLAFPIETIVSAINRVEDVLGADWIEAEVSWGRGIAPAMHVISVGLRLTAIDNLEGTDKLITNLRRRVQNAEAELTAIYMFRAYDPTVQVELYPAVGNNRADFRVRRTADELWTTA